MIVDEADRDIEMSEDPFLEAGIDIPKELPYRQRKSTRRIKIDHNAADNVSTAGSIASVVKDSASTVSAITRLYQFKKRLGSRSNIGLPVPSSIDNQTFDFGGSMPPNMKPTETVNAENDLTTIAGSSEEAVEAVPEVVVTDNSEVVMINNASYSNAAFENEEIHQK